MTQENTPVSLSKDEAEAFVRQLFERAGADVEAAAAVAVGLVAAELDGNTSHGLLQAPVYLRRIRAGSISKEVRLEKLHKSGSISVYDAGLTLGHCSAGRLTEIAIAEARKHGVAAIAARRMMHFGVLGRYVSKIAEAGLIGILMCNTRPMMPVPGGTEMVVGNNPLAVAIPCAGRPPIVFDTAMSAAALGRIRQAAQQGEPIPLGWAVDAEGNDTTDAARAIEGMLLPAGGAKGFGLALMIDLLCALGGGSAGSEIGSVYADPASKADCSALFIALDPDRFGLDQAYTERVAQLADQVRRAAPDPEQALPGDRRRAARLSKNDTITVPPALAKSLDALSRDLGGIGLPTSGG